jgi:hypothetical protein
MYFLLCGRESLNGIANRHDIVLDGDSKLPQLKLIRHTRMENPAIDGLVRQTWSYLLV